VIGDLALQEVRDLLHLRGTIRTGWTVTDVNIADWLAATHEETLRKIALPIGAREKEMEDMTVLFNTQGIFGFQRLDD